MEQKELVGACKDQLNLVLSFFPRVDTKASVVLAIDTGMLGYLFSHFPPFFSLRWWEMLAPASAIACIGVSLWHLYRGAFPVMKGGDRSLVYFLEIAKRTESKFIDEFLCQKEADYAKDLLGQAWRNSEILAEKFRYARIGFNSMALALVPWAVALAEFVAKTRSQVSH